MKTTQTYVLPKSDAVMFFACVGKEMRLIAPTRLFGSDVRFGEVESTKDIVFDYGRDLYPPKRFLLPHHENMFRYSEDGGSIEVSLEAPAQAIIGIRSCDVMAIRFQERFFCNQIVDPYFKPRLDNTVFFSLVCNAPPREECFCICCDSGPYLESDFDVQLTDLGDRFLYEVGSPKGEEATALGSFALREAQSTDLAESHRIQLQADSQFKTVAYLAKAINFISADEVPDDVYEKLGATCFRCGACTNLCPVCTCYTVDDQREKGATFVRRRFWDSCQYSGFTREASGHNPRATPGSRLARRLYHKASYQYIMRDGRHGCVGCGRCVTACLTHLGIPEVVKSIRRAMAEYLSTPEKAVEVK